MKEDKYLDKAPKKIEKLYEEGKEKINIGQEEEGEEILKKILERDNTFVPALNKLAVLRIRQGEAEKAREHIERALQIDPEFPPALNNKGNLVKEKGEIQKAINFYEKAMDINPDYGPAYNNMGVIKREEGEYKESIKYLKKARKRGTLSLKPTDKPIYKDPGCMIPIGMAVLVILILLTWLL